MPSRLMHNTVFMIGRLTLVDAVDTSELVVVVSPLCVVVVSETYGIHAL